MRRRRDITRVHAVIGIAVAVLLAAAVYISYTANNGVPLTPKYRLTVAVPNANRTIRTADVRIAGVRVGQVSSVSARVTSSGHPYAEMELQLDGGKGPLSADTRVTVRPASLLGATYVDLQPGTSHRMVPSGGHLPQADAGQSVELTDLLDVFEPGTRASLRGVIDELGGGLAGRGAAINTVLARLPGLLTSADHVSAALAQRRADLPGFITGLDRFMAALRPSAEGLSRLLANGATTFGALADRRRALGATVDALSPTERVTTSSLRRLRPGLDGLARLTRQLRPASLELPAAVTLLDSTLDAGAPAAAAVPAFSSAVDDALGRVRHFAALPDVIPALVKVPQLLDATKGNLDAFLPAQMQCDIFGLWSRGLSDIFGHIQGAPGSPHLINFALTTLGAQGELFQNAKPSPDVAINYLPHESTQECEAGNEPYTGVAPMLSNPPGLQPASTRATRPPETATARARGAGLLSAPGGAR